MRAILVLKRPYLDHADIEVHKQQGGHWFASGVEEARQVIREAAAHLGRPVVANFAGNSEQTAPGIEAYAETVVRGLLAGLAA